jgi:NAD(P)-dependent dehydrogenase (short-subunit alcohol dehydrogenase family)
LAGTRVNRAGRAVLVTGASKGIGEACTMRLVRDGFRVFAGVRSDAAGAALRDRGGDAVVPVILDVTDGAQIRAAAARVDEETGGQGLFGLVNNAGIAVAGPLEFLPIEDLRRQLEVNVVGQIAVTQACLPMLRRSRQARADAESDGAPDESGGRIIFMSSVSGRSALPFMGPYAASKFALEAAADALRVELRPFGLDVVLVEPGVIITPIWETSLQSAVRAGEQMPVEATEYYGTVIDALRERVGRGMKGLPPDRVARVVARALTTRRPRTRYVIGVDARARILLQAILPDRARDWIAGQVIRRL